jgi:iron complex outermembrane receptor protein
MSRYFPATALVAAVLPALAAPVAAQAATRLVQFSIPAGDTAHALNQLAQQGGVQIIFPYDAIAGRKVSGLQGTFTVEQALRHLIAGQPLMLAQVADKMVVLKSNPAAAAHTDPQGTEQAASHEIIVLGMGQSRQVQTVSAQQLAKAVPGTSPLKTISQLPSVDFQASDPLGIYEWSQQISVRSFTTDQLGYTLDGVPLGNMQYRNNNGLAIGRALITENNGPVSLSQGAGALGTASTSNIGGTIDFSSLAPTDAFGLDAAQTLGSSDNMRSFVRINSGLLPTGGKITASFAHQQADKWKGYGKQKQDQFNAKLVQPLGNHITSTTYLDLVDRREDDYLDVSKSMARNYGWNLDNPSNNFTLAEALARSLQNGTAVPAGYVNADDVVYNGGGVRQDLLAYEKLAYTIGGLKGHTTAYIHVDHGIGTWADPWDPTPAAYGGSPISVSATKYDMVRKGGISRLGGTWGSHRIEGGVWYENNYFHQLSQLHGLTAGAAPTNFEIFWNNPFYTNWDYQFRSEVAQVHIGDAWQASNALRLDFGVKALLSSSRVHTITSSAPKSGSVSARNGFLPTVGFLYKLNANLEFFGDYTRNMAAFVASAGSGPFSSKTSQAAFDYFRSTLKPETTDTIEGGYRYHDGALQLSLTGYYVKFHNRLLAASTSAVLTGNQNIMQNVGSVTSKGVEGALTWNASDAWTLMGSASYNDARYDDNVTLPGGVTVATAGKQVIIAPRVIASGQITYDHGRVFSTLSGRYSGRRYYTYLNDNWVDGAFTMDLSAGVRLIGDRANPRLEGLVNITNITDKRYFATMGTNGFVNSDPNGTYNTLQVAAPRQFFVTLRAHY